MDKIFNLDTQEEFETVLSEVVNNYYSWSDKTQTVKNPALVEEAREDIKQLLLDSKFKIDQIPDLLTAKCWDKAKIAYFTKLLHDNKIELLYSSLIAQNSTYGETITNFDWILKLILGASESNTLKYPLLQLILATECNGIHKKCSYDLNKDMLLKLINTLETFGENS